MGGLRRFPRSGTAFLGAAGQGSVAGMRHSSRFGVSHPPQQYPPPPAATAAATALSTLLSIGAGGILKRRIGREETPPAEHIKQRGRLRREDQASEGRNWTAPCCARRGGIADVAHPAPSDPGAELSGKKRADGREPATHCFDSKLFQPRASAA